MSKLGVENNYNNYYQNYQNKKPDENGGIILGYNNGKGIEVEPKENKPATAPLKTTGEITYDKLFDSINKIFSKENYQVSSNETQKYLIHSMNGLRAGVGASGLSGIGDIGIYHAIVDNNNIYLVDQIFSKFNNEEVYKYNKEGELTWDEVKEIKGLLQIITTARTNAKYDVDWVRINNKQDQITRISEKLNLTNTPLYDEIQGISYNHGYGSVEKLASPSAMGSGPTISNLVKELAAKKGGEVITGIINTYKQELNGGPLVLNEVARRVYKTTTDTEKQYIFSDMVKDKIKLEYENYKP